MAGLREVAAVFSLVRAFIDQNSASTPSVLSRRRQSNGNRLVAFLEYITIAIDVQYYEK
jgi:hypothetical protein